MGLLSKLFGNKEKPSHDVTLLAHMTGQYMDLTEVPDPVFSEKMMGDGFAITPTVGEVVSPVAGEIVQVFPTKHAVGIRTNNGLELLIHIGLETVAMNGEGFTTHVSAGDKVVPGDKLVTFDIELVKEKAKSTVTPCIITNMDIVKSFELLSVEETVANSTDIAKVTVR